MGGGHGRWKDGWWRGGGMMGGVGGGMMGNGRRGQGAAEAAADGVMGGPWAKRPEQFELAPHGCYG